MRKYLIMHRTASEHDAVGNDIAIMAELFSSMGQCLVYAEEQLNPALKYVEEKQLPDLLKDTDTVAVYHHDGYWEQGEKYLLMAEGHKIICYHGITPPELYESSDPAAAELCRKGREQTRRLAKELTEARWLCDSAFCAAELKDCVAKERIAVFPLFHRTEDWADGSPAEELLRELVFSDRTNLLFLGRAAAHRNLPLLIDILRAYRERYGDEVCLWMLGRLDPAMENGRGEFRELLHRYELEDCVRMMGEVSDDTMSAFYLGCDMFISVSSYEGFCSPIAEAQYYKMPVIVRDAGAMPETAGEGALILHDDPAEYAAAIHVLRTREDYRRFLREKGRENYDRRFNSDWMKQRFKGMLKEWDMV